MFDIIISIMFYVSITLLIGYCIYNLIKKVRNKRKNKEVNK